MGRLMVIVMMIGALLGGCVGFGYGDGGGYRGGGYRGDGYHHHDWR